MKALRKHVGAASRVPSADDPQESGGAAPIAALESAAVDPTQFPALRALTGTADDDDAPGDEHARENEAAARETNENTETPEEFALE